MESVIIHRLRMAGGGGGGGGEAFGGGDQTVSGGGGKLNSLTPKVFRLLKF